MQAECKDTFLDKYLVELRNVIDSNNNKTISINKVVYNSLTNILSYLGTSHDASLCSSGWGGDCVNKHIPGSVPVELSVGWDRESASVSYTIGGGGLRLKFSNASNNSSLELETVVTLEIRLCLWLPVRNICVTAVVRIWSINIDVLQEYGLTIDV